MAAYLPRVLVPGRGSGAAVRIENASAMPWPGLAAADDGLVMLLAAWDGAARNPQRIRLPRDLGPGEAVTVPFTLRLPLGPGEHRLRLWLVQAPDDAFPETTAPALVTTIHVAPTPAPAGAARRDPAR